jgi:hypothetical protein
VNLIRNLIEAIAVIGGAAAVKATVKLLRLPDGAVER